MKIMIVEDDPLLSQLYEQIFIKKGYEVVAIASDGDQAISMYNEMVVKPDIVVLDFRLPYKNGLEVSQEIIKRNCSTEILMISGDSTFDREAVIRSGIFFMQKPVLIDEIFREIKLIGGI